MAQTTRQTNLLVNQDWTKVYQSFTNADFVSYDFETLRNSMINYLQTYYPETFNDFLESSEYIALFDMIAFLGQSLAFRTDLNARENFMDTAQRRDSILKLARMLSYNPQRTNSASGLLKFDSISTTDNVYDSNGTNLANKVIHWDDLTNDNWLEQFTIVLNSTLNSSQTIGKPGNSQVINGIQTDEYTFNLNPALLPTAPFSSHCCVLAFHCGIPNCYGINCALTGSDWDGASPLFLDWRSAAGQPLLCRVCAYLPHLSTSCS